MVKAVVIGGDIHLLEPLPADWSEGQTVFIEKTDETEPSLEEIDRDFELLAKMCADSDPEDEERLKQALDEAHFQAKEQVRREMGLK